MLMIPSCPQRRTGGRIGNDLDAVNGKRAQVSSIRAMSSAGEVLAIAVNGDQETPVRPLRLTAVIFDQWRRWEILPVHRELNYWN
jgi:hypothetical protein